MRIALGADHAGYELKNLIKAHLEQQGYNVLDQGTNGPESVDYPDFARRVAEDVVAGAVDRGILVCGTGIGMCISANKVHGIRAANCSSEFEVHMSREHNDANVLALGARVLTPEKALPLVDLFLKTSFEGGRHQRRVDKMMAIENSTTEKA